MKTKTILTMVIVAVAFFSFGSRADDPPATNPPPDRPPVHHAPPPDFPGRPNAGQAESGSVLSAADVDAVIQHAAASVNSEAMVIAVTDRQGDILAVYSKPGAPATTAANFGAQADTNEVAVALARTASFFSNDQAPLSSRTVRFISGIHFPPGIPYTDKRRRCMESRTPIAAARFNTTLSSGPGVPARAHPSTGRTRLGNSHRQSGRERQRSDRGESRRRAAVQARGAGGRRGRGGCARPMSRSSRPSREPPAQVFGPIPCRSRRQSSSTASLCPS